MSKAAGGTPSQRTLGGEAGGTKVSIRAPGAALAPTILQRMTGPRVAGQPVEHSSADHGEICQPVACVAIDRSPGADRDHPSLTIERWLPSAPRLAGLRPLSRTDGRFWHCSASLS